MSTPNRFIVLLGGVSIATSWSLHSANDKLTAAVLQRATNRGDFPVSGQIVNGHGKALITRHFPSYFISEDGL